MYTSGECENYFPNKKVGRHGEIKVKRWFRKEDIHWW
jgi:hypothetical protein